MKHKMKIKELKITSFTTTLIKNEQDTIRGGTDDGSIGNTTHGGNATPKHTDEKKCTEQCNKRHN